MDRCLQNILYRFQSQFCFFVSSRYAVFLQAVGRLIAITCFSEFCHLITNMCFRPNEMAADLGNGILGEKNLVVSMLAGCTVARRFL